MTNVLPHLNQPGNVRSRTGWTTSCFPSWSRAEAKAETSFFSLFPSPYPPPKPQMEPVKFTMILTSPLHSQALPLSLVSSLRINLSVTLLNQVLPGKGPCCRDDRNQTPNGFPGAEGSEGFSCSFSCQRIKERMWVIGLQQCKEEF